MFWFVPHITLKLIMTSWWQNFWHEHPINKEHCKYIIFNMLHGSVDTPCHSARSNLNSVCGLARTKLPKKLILPSDSYSGKWINNHIIWCPRLWKLRVTVMVFTDLLASGTKLCNPSAGTLVPKSNFLVCMVFFFPPFKFIFASKVKLDLTLTNSQLLPKVSLMSFDVFIVTITQCGNSLPFAVRLSIFINGRLSCNTPPPPIGIY